MPMNRSAFVRSGDVVLDGDFEDITPVSFDSRPCKVLDAGCKCLGDALHLPGNWSLTNMAGRSTPSGATTDREIVKWYGRTTPVMGTTFGSGMGSSADCESLISEARPIFLTAGYSLLFCPEFDLLLIHNVDRDLKQSSMDWQTLEQQLL
jgi:hypothetical protein